MIMKIVKLINVVSKFNEDKRRNRILREWSVSKITYSFGVTNRSCSKDRRGEKASRKIKENKNIWSYRIKESRETKVEKWVRIGLWIIILRFWRLGRFWRNKLIVNKK